MTALTKVILADDHALMREAIASLIEGNGCKVVAQAESYHDLEQAINTSDVDLLISDCRMEGYGPLNCLNFIKRFHRDCKVVFLTGLESGELFHKLLTSGVNGLISKKGDPSEILDAIDCVMKDEIYISDIFKQELEDIRLLTSIEYQVLELIVQGYSNKEIAEKLHKAAGTINIHRVKIMRKLDAHNVVDLVHFCRKNGLYDA